MQKKTASAFGGRGDTMGPKLGMTDGDASQRVL